MQLVVLQSHFIKYNPKFENPLKLIDLINPDPWDLGCNSPGQTGYGGFSIFYYHFEDERISQIYTRVFQR